MMKKRFTNMAMAAAVAMMTMTGACPVMAGNVTFPTAEGHTYDVYQIFTGKYNKEGSTEILADLKWGQNGTGTIGENVGEDILEKLVDLDGTDAEKLNTIDDFANLHGTAYMTEVAQGTVQELPDGYYLIRDHANVKNDASTLYLVNVVGDEVLKVKSEKPTFDKQVWDEEADAERDAMKGWGETADHAINESFQFRLEAGIPDDANMDFYKTYAVKFNDIMSREVTFEKIDSVRIIQADGNVITLQGDQYKVSDNAVAGASGITWSVEIEDLKASGLLENVSIRGAKIEVVYSAHLNESAKRGNDDANRNTGSLEYSNNPNVDGEGDRGETPEDTVYVFTYDINNIKTDETKKDGLKDAKFKLYNEDGTSEIGLIYDTELKAYRPVKDGEQTEEMVSPEDGKFVIAGVDAGIYLLKETEAPAGYNLKEEPIKIEIKASHEENNDEKSATTRISYFADDTELGDSPNTIVNKKGSVLPETGGIGTTIFYLAGGLMAFGSGSILAGKKRRRK